MKPPPFAYAAPDTLDEAVSVKAAEGDDAVVLAGGQSLIPLMALRLASPAVVVDLNRVGELAYVRERDGEVCIGALARHRDVEDDHALLRRHPLLADAVPLIGHRAIRNRGTVVGSLAHADPAAEWPAIAVALEATLELAGPNGERDVAAGDMFLGPFMTAIGPDEIVREVRFWLPPPSTGSAFIEHARRHGDFALAGVAAVLTTDATGAVTAARLVLLGVGGTPIRAREAERELEGGPVTEARVQAAVARCREAAEPPSDVHASARYRRHLVGELAARALRLAADRARAA